MQKNTSLIITEEYSKLYEKTVHFKVGGNYVIPVNAGFLQFHIITKNLNDGDSLDDCLDKITAEIYDAENLHPKPSFTGINDFEGLLLIKLICRLEINTFAIYHHSKVATNEYVYWNEFENKILNYYGCQKGN